MRARMNRRVIIATVVSTALVLYGRAAATPAGDVMLADLLVNSFEQLVKAEQAIVELKKSYDEVRRLADYADDAVNAARAFSGFNARTFGDRFRAELDRAYPDLERFRREALAAHGMAGTPWADGTDTLQRLSTYCFSGGTEGCVQLRNALDTKRLLGALAATFGPGAGASQVKAVDAEVTAIIRGNSAQERLSGLQKERLRELLRRCNGPSELSSDRAAKRFAEECLLAAQQAQVLQLEEGQETNVKLAEIARLQALAVEQKNADLKRELAEQEARRQALTTGLENLVSERIVIRSGGAQP
jgi:hypothetical protein